MNRPTFAALSLAVLSSLAACGKHEGVGVAPVDTAAPPGPVETAKPRPDREKREPKHEPGGAADYETIFYPSGSLKIEGYLYRPEGPGPFPAVIYSHGSRQGHERKEVPVEFVGDMLKARGYVVLVAERRGYGKSEGETPEAEAEEQGKNIVARMQEEAGDVLAGYEYLGTLPYVDKKSVGLMGWSLGGIATVFALSRNHELRAGVEQASGSLSWKKSPELRAALADAAGKITAPLLSMDATNDATNESVKAIDDAAAKSHTVHKLVIYPPFTPSHPSSTPPGHLIFSAEGMPNWKDEVGAWLDQYVKAAPVKAPAH